MDFETYKSKLESTLSMHNKLLFNINLCMTLIYKINDFHYNKNIISIDDNILINKNDFIDEICFRHLSRMKTGIKNFHAELDFIDLENYILNSKNILLNNISKLENLSCYINNDKVTSIKCCNDVISFLNQVIYTLKLYKDYKDNNLSVLDECYRNTIKEELK